MTDPSQTPSIGSFISLLVCCSPLWGFLLVMFGAALWDAFFPPRHYHAGNFSSPGSSARTAIPLPPAATEEAADEADSSDLDLLEVITHTHAGGKT